MWGHFSVVVMCLVVKVRPVCRKYCRRLECQVHESDKFDVARRRVSERVAPGISELRTMDGKVNYQLT